MPTNITVPPLGESVIEATVGQWRKREGDAVRAGEILVELETDKVNLEVGAERDGVLARIAHNAGDDVKIGDVLGVISESAPPPASPTPRSGAREARVGDIPTTAGEGRPVAPQPPSAGGSLPVGDLFANVFADKSKATPVAQRFADEQGVNIADVAASGADGRVTKEDVERHIASQKSQIPNPKFQTQAAGTTTEMPIPTPNLQPPTANRQPSTPNARAEERLRMSRRRRTIAQRLVEAQHTAAMLTTFNEVEMSAVMEIRARRKESFQEQHGVGLGFMSFFVKASIGALKAFPPLNAELQDDEIVLKRYYDIGVAVGAAEGLVVPVLRDAERMSFATIETQIDAFVQKTQANTLSIEDLRGGTFTITNGGVFGSLLSTPILNPPQVAILGLHKIEQRPIVLNGAVVIRPMMYVALSYDHRIVDGREAVQFLVRIKQLIEDPETLLLEG